MTAESPAVPRPGRRHFAQKPARKFMYFDEQKTIDKNIILCYN